MLPATSFNDEWFEAKKGITISLKNIGNIYITQGNYEVALEYIKRSLSIAEALGAKYHIMIGYEQLAAVYATQKKYKPAYQYHQMYAQVKDSLFNEEKAKEIGKLEARNEFEKKIAEKKAMTEAEAKAGAERQKTSNFLQYSVIVIFFVSLLTLGGILNLIPLWFINGLVFSAFLLFFEFMLVFLDPYIEALTGGAPALKLAINTVLASMIYPLHQFFEAKLKKRILKKTNDS